MYMWRLYRINSISRSDAGIYRCEATNDCGNSESTKIHKEIQVDIRDVKPCDPKVHFPLTISLHSSSHSFFHVLSSVYMFCSLFFYSLSVTEGHSFQEIRYCGSASPCAATRTLLYRGGRTTDPSAVDLDSGEFLCLCTPRLPTSSQA